MEITMSYYDSAYENEPRPRPRVAGRGPSHFDSHSIRRGAAIWYFVWPHINNGLNPNVKPREVAMRVRCKTTKPT